MVVRAGRVLRDVLPAGVPLVEHVEVVVAVDDHGLPAGSEDPDDLAVGLLRLREVPQEVARHDEVERTVLEAHVLGVHPDELGFQAVLLRVGDGLLDHLLGVVDPDDIHPVGAHYQRQDPGTAAHVQDLGALRGARHPLDGGVHLVPAVRHLVHDGVGESGASQVPVVPDFLSDLHVITL